MSDTRFEAVPFPKEHFDADWQLHLGAHIRLAGFMIEKTEAELRAGFRAEPEAMTSLIVALSDEAERLLVCHRMLEAATARLMIVGCEVAGVSLEDVEIDIQGDTLYIAGTRRDSDCGECVSFHQLEITYSRFEKTLRFPRSIDGAKLEYNYQDGLLIIHLRSSSAGEEKSEAAAK